MYILCIYKYLYDICYEYTSIHLYMYIYMVYHEHHSISNVSLADHDAYVYEWYKSLNFKNTFNVQRCPDDLEFLRGYAIGFISI